MTTIAKADAATRFDELMKRAARGETFEITENGLPLGRLMPPAPQPQIDRAAAEVVVGELIAMRGFAGEATTEDIKAMTHEPAAATNTKKDPARAKAAAERLIEMSKTFGKIPASEVKAMIHEGHRY